jgi:LmbE family N-acetylglucosaminyl deacetylase
MKRKVPIWKRIARSFLMMLGIIGAIYLWNPQRLHYFAKPVQLAKVDPDSKALFTKDTRVTVVVGHPDDAEFYISGTLLKLHQAGAKITLILVTDGDKGYYPWFLTNAEENRKTRRAEQAEASKAYDAQIVFLAGPDGRYNPDEPTLRAKLLTAIQESKPDYLIAFDDEYILKVQHRDHENSGRATRELAPQTGAKWLLCFATMAPNFWVDTTGTWEKRAELLGVHKSQFYGEKLQLIQGTIFDRATTEGEKIGAETAESFRAIPLDRSLAR